MTLQAFLESGHRRWFCAWFTASGSHIDVHVWRETDGTFTVQRQFSRSASAEKEHLSAEQVLANLAQSGIESDEEGMILE